ncbi:hypothetical protein LR948_08495 [Roseivivax sp. GX 12232]|nr:hypothetical protein [Roseivivax sp. GX 12232]MCE0505387.1 hypothetical protein [Roseivivax sp. GX 12232]
MTAQTIWRWSLQRMADVQADQAPSDMERAIWFRQALMIGILTARPVRRRTLLSMNVDGHLDRHASGFRLKFSAEDIKDRKARDMPLLNALVDPMDAYLSRIEVFYSAANLHRDYGLANTANLSPQIAFRVNCPKSPSGISASRFAHTPFDMSLPPQLLRRI